MIDLTGLKPLSDVNVGVVNNSVTLNFAGRSLSEEIKDSVLSLKGIGMSVCSQSSRQLSIFTHNLYDPMQVAEKLSIYLESKGLKVVRRVSDPQANSKSPSIEVQSFILA